MHPFDMSRQASGAFYWKENSYQCPSVWFVLAYIV